MATTSKDRAKHERRKRDVNTLRAHRDGSESTKMFYLHLFDSLRLYKRTLH